MSTSIAAGMLPRESATNDVGLPGITLGATQIAAFREQGFLTLEKFCSGEEIDRLRSIFSRLFEQRAGRREGAHYDLTGHDEDDVEPGSPTIISPASYAPELRDLKIRALASELARQLLGSDVHPSFEHAILKPSVRGEATPWHQDEAYRFDAGFDYEQISFWIPLQEATVDNGCMRYVPGSHLRGVLPHHPARNDPKVHAIECADGAQCGRGVDCPLPAGGVAIHHGRTLHYAGPNTTDNPRIAYILAFELPPVAARAERVRAWSQRGAAANVARRLAWRRRGGIFVEAWRMWRNGILVTRSRLAFELRRAARAILRG